MTQLYLTMPQPGETITEGTIVEWRIREGDTVRVGDVLAQIETEKALFDHESPFEGKITKIIFPDQSRVPVGKDIAVIEVAKEKADHYLMLGLAHVVDEMTSAAGQQAGTAQTAHTKSPTSTTKMAPYVRHLALEAGLDMEVLQKLAAANPEGRVTRETIENYLCDKKIPAGVASDVSRSAEKISAGAGSSGDYTVQSYSPIRLRIAENMALSKTKIPHAHTGLSVDVTGVVEFREKNKDAFAKKHGVNLNFLSLIFPALMAAIKKYPVVNASFVDKGTQSEVRLFNHVNLGIAVGSDAGLVIPVVKNAGAMDFQEFNAALNDKMTRSKSNKLKPDDFTGTTVIFNNFGFYGLNMGVQIIQYPLSATIGMGAIERKVVPVGDKIGIRHIANFFLAFDHRIIDGLEAGSFLTEIKKQIEDTTFDFVKI